MKNVGFFGGTFDPIHFGHLNLAIQLLELRHLDAVIFCPAYCSPFKSEKPPHASPQHRLEMVRLAIEGIPHFRLTDYEIERNDPSYTIDTLNAIKEKDVKFRLLLSEEAAIDLPKWKNYRDLIELAPPLIGARSTSSKIKKPDLTPTKIFEISSTEIRERLKKEQYAGHLVPEKVLEYIQANGLYK